MIVHFLIESSFYTDRVIDKMQKICDKKQTFVCVGSNRQVRLINELGANQMEFRALHRWLQTTQIDRIYIHFLSNTAAYLIHKNRLEKLPIYWILWGADFYGLPGISNDYYLPKSKPFAWKRSRIKDLVASILHLPSPKMVEKLLPSINYFVGYEEEYALTQNALGQPMKFIPWEYYFQLDEIKQTTLDNGGDHILIGNSDDPMNNHLDILSRLSEKKVTYQVLMPIAGAKESYLQAIKMEIKRTGLRVQLLENTMEPSKFFEELNKAGYVIFGHLRQQGVGTILPLLYAGKKIFIWEANPLFQVFKRWGLKIEPIETFDESQLKPYSNQEVDQQKKVMEKMMSKEADLRRWQKVFE